MAEFTYLTSELEALTKLRNYYRWIFDEIRPFLGTRLAEIGAGLGTFTDILATNHLLAQPTVRMDVFEPAVNLYQQLADRLGQKHRDLIHTNRLVTHNGYFTPTHEQFDTIIMINVLEHIEDDRSAVRIAYDSLSPGGMIVLFVPALPRLFSKFDRAVGHHRRYTQPALSRLLREERLDVVKSSYMDVIGLVPWYLLNVLGGIQTVRPWMVRLYDRVLVPVTRRIERLWPPVLGKNALMIGRKSG